MSKNKPLGRGLGALISPNINLNRDENITVSANEISNDDGNSVDVIFKVEVEKISPNPFQPRTNFEPEALEELKKSILQNGLIQPITVHRNGNGTYELISGERRLRAFKDIGYKEIPAYVIKVDSNEAKLAMALIENIQREKLNAIEVAHAYKRLMDECSLTQEEIAERVGKERTTVTNAIRLLKLPEIIQHSLIKEEITPGHARALINIPNTSSQIELLEKIISENLSVRKVENLVKKILTEGDKKPGKASSNSNTVTSSSHKDVEDRLRRIFGTKVICKQNREGAGEIQIEFYSHDELERILDLIDAINQSYS